MDSYIFNKVIFEKIRKTDTYKRIKFFSVELLIEDMKKFLNSFGGLIVNVPHESLCYIQRLCDLETKYDDAVEIIESNQENPYILITLLFYLRLSKYFKPENSFKKYLKDFRRVKIIRIDNTISYEYIDVLVDDLLEKERIFGIYLKRY